MSIARLVMLAGCVFIFLAAFGLGSDDFDFFLFGLALFLTGFTIGADVQDRRIL
jgi:hypothetical protein